MIGCRPLSAPELAAVSAAFRGEFEHRDRLLFWLGVTSGFRISELLSLRLGDLWRADRVADAVRVRRRYSKGKREGMSAPVAPLITPLLVRWLAEFRPRYGSNPEFPIFHSRSGDHRSISRMQAHRALAGAYFRAGIDGGQGELATHCMRKTYAKTMYDHFGDIFKVQKALRHASPASTVAYLSFQEAELVDAVALQWPTARNDSTTASTFEARILPFAR